MQFTEWLPLVGLPLFGWIAYEIRSMRIEVRAEFRSIWEQHRKNGERIAKLEAAAK